MYKAMYVRYDTCIYVYDHVRVNFLLHVYIYGYMHVYVHNSYECIHIHICTL